MPTPFIVESLLPCGVLTQLLIDAGLDVNATDKEGKSPLETCNRSFMHTKAEKLKS
jgi:ankyrin repeat protein